MTFEPRVRNVLTLGTAQTLAWGSTYYLPAVLAPAMARDLRVDTPTVFAAFTAALLVSAAIGPWAGRLIDRHGGRPVLATTSLVFALGLSLLARAETSVGLFAAWMLIGVGMGSGLYEGAFASLVKLHGQAARPSITGITLIAGFASTVAWPLSAWMETHWGWRDACLAWAALHLALGLPLNLLLPKAPQTDPLAPLPGSLASATGAAGKTPAPDENPGQEAPVQNLRSVLLLSFVFSGSLFVSTAIASHLPQLLMASGVTLAAAVALGGLIGPAQVAGRLLEFGVLQKVHPLLSARLATATHPVAALTLLVFGGPVAAVFCLLHGAGNGILTIAMGTLPLALFGSQGYGLRQGLLLVPARIAQALAPWVFGLWVQAWGLQALYASAAIGALMLLALVALRVRPTQIDASRSSAAM